MRVKYIEERFPRWFKFGEYPDTGNVDVADPDKDVLYNVTHRVADAAIEARDRFVDDMIAIVQENPDSLYGRRAEND